MTEAWFIYLALGAFAGLIAGLLGVGGGLIIVPVLAWVFLTQGVDANVIMHMALATSLATIVFTSISSVYAHHRHGHVAWGMVLRLAPSLILGALAGAWLAKGMETGQLQRLFAVFEIAVGLYMLLGSPKPSANKHAAANHLELAAAGSAIGVVSAILGIGGGTLTVPYLSWRGVLMQRAVAVAAACGLPIALGGAIGYAWGIGAGHALPAASIGYIYLPAMLAICATSLMFAPLGAKWASVLKPHVLKRIFALFLLLLGVLMLLH